MAHVVEDRILESSTTTGTGVFTLASAITGFRRFNAVCAVGDTVPYFIEAIDSLGQPTGDYEYGTGTYTAANQLTRTTVTNSSNGGALVNFAAGSKNVGISLTKAELTSQITQAVSSAIAAAVPPGLAMDWTGATAPAGWVEASGQVLTRATYPALWAYAQASGNIAASDAAWASAKGKYSPGDGATTFRVPDVRGEFIRVWDHGSGVDSARTVGSNQADDFKSHTHPITSIADGQAAPGGENSHVRTSTGAFVTGAAGGSETRPRNVAWMKIIKT